ncbi:hypothetical protein ABFS82_08G227500 [Erythranthe guttata]|uniref:uncharacterized protein LOC105965321 n=1 Tax=Erythranthe guttata TaxID=4155 RepID=UPI00064DECF9|nr:PREDICTED: uncharacterized protein LOC105965321 [Erythranthe guttata]|eukprot:XP_012845316.1 PREDICTED: uncharacterized protein LOC105965321 [Erythranthe guttata]
MDEGKTFEGLGKSRSALGDLTNRVGKRGFTVREENGIRSFDFTNKDVPKRLCVSPRPCTEIGSLKGNVISSLSKTHNENKDPNKISIDVDADFDGAYCSKGNNVLVTGNSNVDGGDKDIEISVDSCAKIDNIKEDVVTKMDTTVFPNCTDANWPDLEHSSKKSLGDLVITGGDEYAMSGLEIRNEENEPNSLDLGKSDAIESIHTEVNNELKTVVSGNGNDGIDINCCHNEGDYDNHGDNFVLSQSGSIDCPILPDSQESRVFGIDNSSAKLKEDECAYMSGAADSIKSCSCSFCTQAGYIWLDLQHQDIKARLSAMKKSQKEANILAERSCRIKVNEKHGGESSTRGSKLESHLMQQWRSLFQGMAVLWEDEGNQLEASLLPLSDLREKCKSDLELINAKRSEKH